MVVSLARIFAQQPPIAAVIPILDKSTSLELQQAVVKALDGVDDRFREQALRHLVRAAERRGDDVAEEVWEEYYSLKTPAALQRIRARGTSVVRYDLPGGLHVAIREDRNTLVQGGGTGHRTWESSLALTEFLCGDARVWDDVVELGAGTGLVGMALARLGRARRVQLTDGSPPLVAKLAAAVEENGLQTTAQASVLSWEDIGAAAQLPKGALVVAGDVLYGLPSQYYVLLDCIAMLQPRRVLVSNPIRNPDAYASFKALCAARSIRVTCVARYAAASADETTWMFLVSVPPIPVEILELDFSAAQTPTTDSAPETGSAPTTESSAKTGSAPISH